MTAISFWFYAYADPRFVWLLAFSIVWSWALGAATFRSLAAEGGRTPLSKNLVRTAVVVDLALLGLVQVLRLLRRQHPRRARQPRPRRHAAIARDRAARRHLVLHVPRHQLRDRHRPRAAAAAAARRAGALHVVLPAPRRGTDRAGERVRPAAARAGRSPTDPLGRGVPADRVRPLQEGRRVQLPGHRDRRPGVRRALRARLDGPPRRRLRLRHPDLRRLLRLHGHRDRLRAPARHPLPAELRRPVPRAVAPGLLASLAHDAVALAARLPLHPARWQPARRAPDPPQPDAHDGDRRAVARRGLDVPRVGRDPRRLPGPRARREAAVGARPPAPGPPVGAHRRPPVAAHVQRGVLRVDLLPLRVHRRGLRGDRRHRGRDPARRAGHRPAPRRPSR